MRAAIHDFAMTDFSGYRSDASLATESIKSEMHNRWLSWLLAIACCALLLFTGCGAVGGSGATGSWQYTALGDSLAFGAIAAQGYVPRYQSDLEVDANPNVVLVNLGHNGWHSGDLLNALQNDSTFRTSVSSAQVITWDIGGDDLLHAVNLFNQGTCGGPDNQDCLRSAVATFIPNWDTIVAEILSLRDPKQTILRTMDVYDPFITQEKAIGAFAVIQPYLQQVNSHIATSAAANGIPMAAVHQAFNGVNGDEDPSAKGYIAIDGVHPNDTGHQVIADLFRNLRYAPLK